LQGAGQNTSPPYKKKHVFFQDINVWRNCIFSPIYPLNLISNSTAGSNVGIRVLLCFKTQSKGNNNFKLRIICRISYMYLKILLRLFFIRSSSCSITVSNTTSYCSLSFLLTVFIYICSLGWFIFSRSIQLMYLINCFSVLLVSSLLLTGHLLALFTLLFIVALSFTSLSHWNIIWSTVCMPCLHVC
jgi:hypothetical protein